MNDIHRRSSADDRTTVEAPTGRRARRRAARRARDADRAGTLGRVGSAYAVGGLFGN